MLIIKSRFLIKHIHLRQKVIEMSEYENFWMAFMGRTNDLLNEMHRTINTEKMTDDELEILQRWIDGMQAAVDALGDTKEVIIRPTFITALYQQLETVREILNRVELDE